MDTTTKYIDNLGLNNTPFFYQNMAGNAQVKRSNSFGVVNSSIVPIVKRINQIIKFEIDVPHGSTSWLTAAIGHGLGTIYYIFARWRIKGDAAWTMCPQPNYDNPASDIPPRFWFEKIETSSTTFGFYDPILAMVIVPVEIEVDVYYVDIPFKI